MRKAFSMVTAIFVILILATISMLMLNMAATTTNSTVEQYRHEQAALYAKSFTELAILKATQDDRTDGCITSSNGSVGNFADGSGYEANATITWVLNDTTQACTVVGNTSNIIVDTTVQYRNPIDPANAPITTYFKRTLQKI
jgi:type II secretory pathway component PulK